MPDLIPINTTTIVSDYSMAGYNYRIVDDGSITFKEFSRCDFLRGNIDPENNCYLINDWNSSIRESRYHSEIISIFRYENMDKIADRLEFLNNLFHEDPNEPQIVLESLREMAVFMLELKLPKPLIGLTDEGFIEIQWYIQPNGLLAIDFLPTKEIEYIAIYPEPKEGVKQQIISKTSSKNDVLNIISSLIQFLEAQ